MIGIRVVSRSGVPLDRLSLGVPPMARFGDAVGDIGRGADCTLILPDPDRQISRKQVLITCRGGQHYICPIGSNFAVELDGKPLAPEVEVTLRVGSEIRIGAYLLRVEDVSEPKPARPAPVPVPARAPPSRRADDPLATVGRQTPAARASVFSDLLDTPTSSDATAPSAPRRPTPQEKRRPGVAPPAESDDTRPDLDFNVGEPTGTDNRKTARRFPASAAAARAKPDRRKAPDDSLAALFSSLGVAAPQDRVQAARQVKLIAELLRASISGTLELLAARTITKRELGAEATQLQVRTNNPLKFSPDVDAALANLLSPPQRGFIEPLAAVRDAFGDLRAHQLAMLTGMRAALDEVLARFDPATLEPRLTHDAIWEKLVPSARKAKLWEQYSQKYAEILREVEDNFDSLFGRAFLRAYQAQVAEFSRAQRPGTVDES